MMDGGGLGGGGQQLLGGGRLRCSIRSFPLAQQPQLQPKPKPNTQRCSLTEIIFYYRFVVMKCLYPFKNGSSPPKKTLKKEEPVPM
jgi:hypothetical protein